MPKFNPFKFKVIETVYNGYHFRSRLEARWAVFFDTLGIEYRYEAEGFNLEGTWYLPDFWLPQFNCWIEIKGQEPTEEELNKIHLLSQYTGKQAHLFYGEIGSQDTENAFTASPPRLWTYLETEIVGKESTRLVHVAPDILLLRQRMEECCLRVSIDEENDISLASYGDWKLQEIPEYLEVLQKQQVLLLTLQDLISDRKEEIVAMLVPNKGWEYEFFTSTLLKGTWWGQCSECGTIGLHRVDRYTHRGCDKGGVFTRNSASILSANAAARQARF